MRDYGKIQPSDDWENSGHNICVRTWVPGPARYRSSRTAYTLRRHARPGRPDLLIIGFQATRQICVKDIDDIRFVDSHAKRDGRHHHHAGLGHEAVLVGVARLLGHASVISQRPNLILSEKRSQCLFLRGRYPISSSTNIDASVQKKLLFIQYCSPIFWKLRLCLSKGCIVV
jgi:hypothetical protein